MKALVLTAASEFSYDTSFPDPTPGAGEVLVQIKACGICGSDIHGMDGRSGRRQPCPSSWVMRPQVKSSRWAKA
jgi:L-iditol 2-dehydrogenase